MPLPSDRENHRQVLACTDLSIYGNILAFIANSGTSPLSAQEIAQATGISVWSVRRAMADFRARGLVEMQSSKRTLIYTAVPGNPALTHLKIFTTIQTLEPLVKRLRPLTHRIVLYGDCADGTDIPADPIGIFIVAPNPTAVLNITDTWRIPVSGGALSRGSHSRKAGPRSSDLRPPPPRRHLI